MWPCPVLLCPALPLVPSPPSQCVSVTQRRLEAEGPSGAPPPPPLQRQHQQREQQQQEQQEQRLQRPCGATGSACSPGKAHHKAGPRLSPVRAPRRSARLGVPLGLAGLGGWREGGGLRGCLRSTGARAAPAPLVSALRLLAAGRAGVPAPSRRPVSAALARGRGRGGPAARNFLRACAGGGAAVRAPGRPRGGGGERSLRRRIPRCGRKRLCEELPGTPSPPPRLERPRGGCEPRAGWLPGSRSRGRAAGRPSGRGTKGRWAFLLFV